MEARSPTVPVFWRSSRSVSALSRIQLNKGVHFASVSAVNTFPVRFVLSSTRKYVACGPQDKVLILTPYPSGFRAFLSSAMVFMVFLCFGVDVVPRGKGCV
jgi:hypothetical protein